VDAAIAANVRTIMRTARLLLFKTILKAYWPSWPQLRQMGVKIIGLTKPYIRDFVFRVEIC
jgi:hypothetical protein